MHTIRYLECLRADATRLGTVAGGVLTEPVPSVPEWTVEDLVHHVAEVYLHKVSCMRLGHPPPDWPPDFSGQGPIELLAQAHAELRGEFDSRDPSEVTFTFYPHDRTVGFWVRRMAQETAIHRYDGELAADEITPVPDDLALDGIDEMLTIFLGWELRENASDPDVAKVLADADERTLAVRSGDSCYLIRPAHTGVDVSWTPPEAVPHDVAATVSGDPSPMLLWLWHRVGDGAVRIEGDTELVDYFHRLLTESGQ